MACLAVWFSAWFCTSDLGEVGVSRKAAEHSVAWIRASAFLPTPITQGHQACRAHLLYSPCTVLFFKTLPLPGLGSEVALESDQIN